MRKATKAERAAVAKTKQEALDVLELARFVHFTDGRELAARVVLDEIEKAGF